MASSAHLSSLSSSLLSSPPFPDIFLATPSLTLPAHQAILLPLLPSLLPLLCSSCSPHDPLLLLLPDTPAPALRKALGTLYREGQGGQLAELLGLQVKQEEHRQGQELCQGREVTQIENKCTNESESDMRGSIIDIHQEASRKDNDRTNQKSFHTEEVLQEPPKECQDVQEHRERFNEKIAILKKETQGTNVKMFNNSVYEAKLARLKALKSGGRGLKMTPKDYQLVSKYTILQVQGDGGIMKLQLVKIDKNGARKVYATYEMLFDAISEHHHTADRKHPGRLNTHKSINRVYTNITMAQVIAFVDTCSFCKLKRGETQLTQLLNNFTTSVSTN